MDHVFKDRVSEEDEARRRAIEIEIMAGSNASSGEERV